MKIGIFGGAFNPIHNGHIKLIEHQFKALQLDKIILIPTANPPHKSSQELITGEHRINMLSLALSSFENKLANKIEISDIELKRSGKSYTYTTLKSIKEIYPNDELFLLIGSDQFLYFKNWYKYEKILKMAHICAVARANGEQEKMQEFLNSNKGTLLSSCTILKINPLPLSSTDIRCKVKNNENIDGLVPKSVCEYIRKNNLYV